MIISNIEFKNFRNLNLAFKPASGFNLVLGENGVGKSNLLDAIYHLALGKTFKPYALTQNINFDSKDGFALINSAIISEDQTKELKIIFALKNDSERKRLEVNTKPTTKAKFTQHLNVILFAPHNINLILGTPDIRRSELDDFASLCDYKYAAYIQEYQQIVKNRNRLLKSIANGEAKVNQLSYWDAKLIKLGSYIIAKRLQILNALLPVFTKLAQTHFKEEMADITINYLSKFKQDQLKLDVPTIELTESIAKYYEELLLSGLDKEINSKQTQYGPHKDDFEILHNNKDMKLFASRGQQRIATFLFKLACWEYLANLKNTKPIVLLDDVMSELDNHNRLLLENIIAELETQTFITTTHATDFSEKISTKFKVLNLS